MALPLPRPSTFIDLTKSAVDQAKGSAISFAAVPARAFGVLDGVEALVKRINGVVDRVETVIDRAEAAMDRTESVLDGAEMAVGRVAAVTAAAHASIAEASQVAVAAGRVIAEAERVSGAAAVVVAEAEQVSTAAAMVVGEAEQVAQRASAAVTAAGSTAATADELLSSYAPALRRAAPMATRFIEQLSPEEVNAAIRLVDELPKLTRHLTDDVLPILATLDRVGPDIHDLLEVTRDLKLAVAGIPGLKMLRRRGEERLADEDLSG
jgi:ABC-type transporter Mla subunit MlaD